MELNKKIAIQIISVESPNRFWFRTKENEQKINADIEAYMVSQENSKNDSHFVPNLNEKVIVETNKRFEIAQIKKVDKENDTFFCLFTNGNFRKVERHDITLLARTNQLFNESINTILLGSIIGVVPGKMVRRKSDFFFVVDLRMNIFYK